MKNTQENLSTLTIWSRNVTTSTREPPTCTWIRADMWPQDGAICSKNRKIVPYHRYARIPRLTVSVPAYGSWFNRKENSFTVVAKMATTVYKREKCTAARKNRAWCKPFIKSLQYQFTKIGPGWMQYIKHERPCLTTFPNTEKRVENTTCSGVVLTNFKMFGNLVKHCIECLIYLLNRNLRENGRKKIEKIYAN